jgi:pimeloyl-ACP methyl ester carboxylesterase
MLREPLGFLELPKLALRMPGLLRAVPERPAATTVLPGFGADDRSTWPLRAYLRRIGHDASGWGLGVNTKNVPETVERVGESVRSRAERLERRIALIGWSLGGYIAREVARDLPDHVDRVVTFGSPVIGGPKYTAAAAVYRRLGEDVDKIEQQVEERKRVALTVPVTAIYSQRDGVVSWRACVDDEGNDLIEHVEVRSTHLGLGFSAEVFRLVADRLDGPAPRPASALVDSTK